MKLLRPIFYDEFHCIGGECPFTCCRGWDIVLSKEEAQKHVSDEKGCGFDELFEKFSGREGYFKFRLVEDEKCPFLREDGLCEMVLTNGEKSLSDTCQSFPRELMVYDDVIECQMSNTCPEILRFLMDIPAPLTFEMDEYEPMYLEPTVYPEEGMIFLRDNFIDLVQTSVIPFWMRLYMLYQFSKEFDQNKNAILMTERIRDENVLADYIELLSRVGDSSEESLLIIGSIMRDIGSIEGTDRTIYGVYVHTARELLPHILDISEDYIDRWRSFIDEVRAYDNFFENFSVNYLFTRGKDIINKEETKVIIQTLILEYVMIRGLLFLTYLRLGHLPDESDVILIATYYARMCEHGILKKGTVIRDNADSIVFSDEGFLYMLV